MAYRFIDSEQDRDYDEQDLSPLEVFSRRSVAVLPTLFTLGNLLAGFAAIFLASRPTDTPMPLGWTPLTFASICIFLGLALDGLDGRIARLTKTTSGLGEQLDSMADMVTFGVAPAFLAVQLVGIGTPFVSEANDDLFGRVAIVIGGIYVACAALRLARFNVELENDAEPEMEYISFKGLPSPGAGGTVASLILLHQHFLAQYPARHWTVASAAYAMLVITLAVSVAMVSQFRYVHVMNRYVRGQAPFATIVKAVFIGLFLIVRPQWALAAGFVLYAASGPVSMVYRSARRARHRRRAA